MQHEQKTLNALNRAHDLTRAWESDVRDGGHDLGGGCYRILLVLAMSSAPISINKLASKMNVTYQTVGKTLKDLSRQKYVQVKVDADDRRIRLVCITKLGRRMVSINYGQS